MNLKFLLDLNLFQMKGRVDNTCCSRLFADVFLDVLVDVIAGMTNEMVRD